jgi:catechol 2,3-dioxygenase-like lactoylglutathione lyase family enzyme
VTISASDFAASLAFYDAALGALGLSRILELGDEEESDAAVEAVGWGSGEAAVLWLVSGGRPTTGAHVCLRAAARTDVEAFHGAAVTHGGRSHQPPRRWAIYRRGDFVAGVFDPDGNLVQAVADE